MDILCHSDTEAVLLPLMLHRPLADEARKPLFEKLGTDEPIAEARVEHHEWRRIPTRGGVISGTESDMERSQWSPSSYFKDCHPSCAEGGPAFCECSRVASCAGETSTNRRKLWGGQDYSARRARAGPKEVMS